MIRQPISQTKVILLTLCSMGIIIGTYSWLSYRQHASNSRDTSMPNAPQLWEGAKKVMGYEVKGADSAGEEVVLQEAVEWRESWLYLDFKATYWRLFVGLFFGVTMSFFVGIAMGCYAHAEAFFKFPVSFFARIPPTGMMVVYFVVFGTELKMFSAMIALGIFPILTQTICQSVQKDVKLNSVYKAYTLGASTFEVIWGVVVQKIMPRFIEAVRLQIGPAMIFLIAAEMMVSDEGFGYRLRIQSRLLNMNVVYLYLMVLGMTGYMLDYGLSTFRRWLCPWFGR